MRKKGDNWFIDILNNSSKNAKVIKSRFIRSHAANYSLKALHLFAENYSANLHNLKIFGVLPSKCLIFPCIDNEVQSSFDYDKNISQVMKKVLHVV